MTPSPEAFDMFGRCSNGPSFDFAGTISPRTAYSPSCAIVVCVTFTEVGSISGLLLVYQPSGSPPDQLSKLPLTICPVAVVANTTVRKSGKKTSTLRMAHLIVD
jgi:hypothetical protein